MSVFEQSAVFMTRVQREYETAVSRHPFFARFVCRRATLEVMTRRVDDAHLRRDAEARRNQATGHSVFMCKYAEFLEAYTAADYPRALDSLAQAGAAIMRLSDMVHDKMNGVPPARHKSVKKAREAAERAAAKPDITETHENSAI